MNVVLTVAVAMAGILIPLAWRWRKRDRADEAHFNDLARSANLPGAKRDENMGDC